MKNSGFTLMEMLIATALTALLLTATFSTSTNLLKGEKHVREHKQHTQDIYAIFNLIEKDLNSYISDFRSNSTGGFSFLTLLNDNVASAKRSDQLLVNYAFFTKEGEITLHRLTKDPFFADETHFNSPLLKIKQALISYGNESGKSMTSWKSDKTNAPAVVNISLTDLKNRVWVRRIPIMVRTN